MTWPVVSVGINALRSMWLEDPSMPVPGSHDMELYGVGLDHVRSCCVIEMNMRSPTIID